MHGTPMYALTCKLKSLKSVFRAQRKAKGNVSKNVVKAKGFLQLAQQFLEQDRHNLLQLERVARLILLKASKIEQCMLQQHAKLQWLQGGDQCTRIFFRKVASRRARQKISQIFDNQGTLLREEDEVAAEFTGFYEGLLGGQRCNNYINLLYLRPWARHVVTREEGDSMITYPSPEQVGRESRCQFSSSARTTACSGTPCLGGLSVDGIELKVSTRPFPILL
ncbi:UNVERIFIED_CONTAM: hypothetical protein Slati_2468400 [Sesamum latifolium]|uniref:Uncharacterized protein n=1 Tax=Sesamum latifolium TaxID=2727402 RepID=A0AAW2WDN2_9LAMI